MSCETFSEEAEGLGRKGCGGWPVSGQDEKATDTGMSREENAPSKTRQREGQGSWGLVWWQRVGGQLCPAGLPSDAGLFKS